MALFSFMVYSTRFGGLENLSLIPGTVGAAPIQNIGAYGVALQSVFHQLEAIHLQGGQRRTFSKEDCEFGYRQSVFKGKEAKQWLITHVSFKLTVHEHEIKTEYGAIQQQLAKFNLDNPGPKDISDAVVAIRQAKLPDPKHLGNAGSFFKNPVVEASVWESLVSRFPHMPYYREGEKQYKIPAGWLIDQCGWKGKRVGNVGCYEKQALVIVNHGGATGKEVLDFSKKVQARVLSQFGIKLEREVSIVGSGD